MVHPTRAFGGFRHPERIKRNRQKVELLDIQGNSVCAVEDAWHESVTRSEQPSGINIRGLQQTWKMPTKNVPGHIVPTDGMRIRTASGAIWSVLSVSLRSSDMTWWLTSVLVHDETFTEQRIQQ